MKGICKLHDIEEVLRESHIYPSFVINYMKKTGGTGYIRNVMNPNKPEQDGIKKHWLCHNAEQKFGDSENWFRNKIFIPHMEKEQDEYVYNRHFYYFGISFLWRILQIAYEDDNIVNQPFIEELKLVDAQWKKFLSCDLFPPRYNNLNLILTNRVSSHNLNAPRVDYYLTRALDGTVIWTDDYSYVAVYGKFLRFIFWSELKVKPKVNEKFSIFYGDGVVMNRKRIEAEHIFDWTQSRTNEIEKLPKMTVTQKGKVFEKAKKNDKDIFLSSDAVQSIINDKKMG